MSKQDDDKKKKKPLTSRQKLNRLRSNLKDQRARDKANVETKRQERRDRDAASGRKGLSGIDTAYQKMNALSNNLKAQSRRNGAELTDQQRAVVGEQTANQLRNLELNNQLDEANNNGRGANAFSGARAAGKASKEVKQAVGVAKSIRRDLRLARRNAIRMGDREKAADLNIKATNMGIPISGAGVDVAGAMHLQAANNMQANLLGGMARQQQNPVAQQPQAPGGGGQGPWNNGVGGAGGMEEQQNNGVQGATGLNGARGLGKKNDDEDMDNAYMPNKPFKFKF
jgi:hypothetical protein